MTDKEMSPWQEEEAAQRLTDLMRRANPDGPDDDAFWNMLGSDGGERVVPQRRAKAIKLAQLGLAIGQGNLSLGRYLAQLRAEMQLSRDAVARHARLAPQVIEDLEADRWPVQSVDPPRLARACVQMGAIKQVLLDLVRLTPMTEQRTDAAQPSLSRIDTRASLLDNDEGHQSLTGPERILERYVSALASAFDDELTRNQPT